MRKIFSNLKMRHSPKVSRTFASRFITGLTSLSFIMSSMPALALDITLEQNMYLRTEDSKQPEQMDRVGKLVKGSVVSIPDGEKYVVVVNGKVDVTKTLEKWEASAKETKSKFPGLYSYDQEKVKQAFFPITVVSAAAGSTAKVGDHPYMALEFLNRRGNAYVTTQDSNLYARKAAAQVATAPAAGKPQATGNADKGKVATAPAAQKPSAKVPSPAKTQVPAPAAKIASTKTADTAVSKTSPPKAVVPTAKPAAKTSAARAAPKALAVTPAQAVVLAAAAKHKKSSEAKVATTVAEVATPKDSAAEVVVAAGAEKHSAKRKNSKPAEKIQAAVCVECEAAARNKNMTELAAVANAAAEDNSSYYQPLVGAPKTCEEFINADGTLGAYGRIAKYDVSQRSELLTDTAVRSVGNICPNFKNFSDEEKQHFWVYVIGALAAQESGCNSYAHNPVNTQAVGLLQQERNAKKWRIMQYFGEPCAGDQFDANNNIGCGVTNLVDNLVGKGRPLYGANGNYWQAFTDAYRNPNATKTPYIISKYEACGAEPISYPNPSKRHVGKNHRRRHKRTSVAREA